MLAKEIDHLIDCLPPALDQTYEELVEDVRVGKAIQMTRMAGRVYNAYYQAITTRKTTEDKRRLLKQRLASASEAVRAIIECHENGQKDIAHGTIKHAYSLRDNMALYLGTVIQASQN